ncbi:hypothetical protein AB0F17_15890 [Nonomuraea sp. NPDC026600]|uniref:hypothetical protein n=1 Tax=Nonomuraea sp. NPDC026600 TaxID=3155363 RepID=UPI00340432A0
MSAPAEDALTRLLRATWASGYVEAQRQARQASVELGDALSNEQIDEWVWNVLPPEHRDQVGQFAAALVMDAFHDELTAAGLLLGGGA